MPPVGTLEGESETNWVGAAVVGAAVVGAPVGASVGGRVTTCSQVSCSANSRHVTSQSPPP